MKAIVYERYGPPDVLELRDVPQPTPKDDELLIRIHATTVTSGDWRLRSMDVPFGFRLISRLAFGITKPRKPILGSELSGVVEAVGKDVTRFRAGDAVFAYTDGMGAHAEYLCLPQNAAVALKPEGLSFEEAAALSFGGTTALNFFRRGKLQRGERVLINGASGAVGSAAVQIAKHLGARVTAVCSGANEALVRSLGADRVIDYTKEDFARGGEQYDVIMDTAGTAPWPRSKRALARGGRLLQVLGELPDMLRAPWVALVSDKRVVAGPAAPSAEDSRLLATLAERGELKPVIGRTYALEQIAEAHRYVDSGRKRGNVVVVVHRGVRAGATSGARELQPTT